tara:strand:- start:121 stop:663 length:543 start_codon:yes stop_codon:yes gene_type:complete
MNNIALDKKIPILESRIIRMECRQTEAPRNHCALVLDCGAGETKAVLLRYSQMRRGLYISQFDMMKMVSKSSSSSSNEEEEEEGFDEEEDSDKTSAKKGKYHHHRQDQGRIHVEVVSEAPSMIDFIQNVDVRTLSGYKKSRRENLDERPFYFLEKSPLVSARKGADAYRLRNEHFVMYVY